MTPVDTTRCVDLSADLVSRVEARLPRTDFESADEYIEYVLEDVLYHLETERDSPSVEDSDGLEERLRSLGYLDN